MRVLHLGFEDHRRPGAGGGSHRNHEINRRLAALGHSIEVVTARFPGAESRVENGVRYRHVGDGRGYYRSILTYHAWLAPLVARVRVSAGRPDLVVEDFAPPFSTLGIGAFAGVPSVGNVQGYFAANKAREYGIPVSLLTGVERWGTRRHASLIALSRHLAEELDAVAPHARISVVGMGLSHQEIEQALEPAPTVVPGRMVFLGRLELEQKGIDLLLESMRHTDPGSDAHLVVAGDGRDAQRVREMVQTSGLEGRVSLIGRVAGADKWRLLASAQLCVMPSRYETFGLSALEALACGTPVVGFDIPCFNETVPASAGRLVHPFDVDALGRALRELLAAPALCAALGRAGSAHARRFNWEAVAASQLDSYEAAIRGRGRG